LKKILMKSQKASHPRKLSYQNNLKHYNPLLIHDGMRVANTMAYKLQDGRKSEIFLLLLFYPAHPVNPIHISVQPTASIQ